MDLATLSTLILLAQPGTPAPPTLDQVLDRYVEARGGRAAWAAVQTLELEGSFTAFSLVEPVKVLYQRPDLYLFETVVRGQPMVYGHDGSTLWWRHGGYGIGWPRPVAGPEIALIRRAARLAPLLLEPGDAKLELVGEGEVDGQPTMAVRATLADGAVETWHLDRKTGLEVAIDSTTWDFTQRGESIEERAYYSDFRKVGALVVPFQIEKEYGVRNTVLELTAVRLDPEIDSARFRQPLDEAMMALRSLVGEWQVEVQTPQAPEQPWASAAGSSTITADFGGALLEERLRFDRDGAQVEVERRLGWDRFQGVYRLLQFDNWTSYPAIYTGKLEDGKLTLDDLATATPVKSFGTDIFERMSWQEIGADGFRIEVETSTDAGATWEPAQRFVYKRSSNPSSAPRSR